MTPIPDSIYLKMRAYRNKYIPLPKEYIDWHLELALVELRKIIPNTWFEWKLDSDGWNDGIETVHASIIYKGIKIDCKWIDTKQEFISSNRGGKSLKSIVKGIDEHS
jgi:hypothetical protein